MSSEGIIAIQKSLFLYTFLCDSSFSFPFQKKKTIEMTMNLEVISLSNADSFFTARKCFSSFEIIKRITCFSRFKLCFET